MRVPIFSQSSPPGSGHANDFPNQVYAPHTLISSAAGFGKGARVAAPWPVALEPDRAPKLKPPAAAKKP